MSTNELGCGSKAFTFIELLVILAVVIFLVLFIGAPASPRAKARAQRINCVINLKQIGLAFKTWTPGQVDENPVENSVTNDARSQRRPGPGQGEGFPMGFTVANGGSMDLTNSSLVIRTFAVMSNELGTPKLVICPADDRNPAAAFDARFSSSNISYFIGLDGREAAPQMFLAGDRNLTNGLPVNDGVLLLPTNRPAGWDQRLHRGQGDVLLCDGSVQQVSSSKLWQQLCATGTNVSRIMMP
jgi:hypothetical protein